MAEFSTVLYQQRGHVAVITLNRPDKLNTFNQALCDDLAGAVTLATEDESVRAILLCGAGKHFSAGADLNSKFEEGYTVEDSLNENFKPTLLALWNTPKPVISAVNGSASGVGSSFVLVSDIALMAEDAYLYMAFMPIALVPDGGATWQLVRQLGHKRAYEFIVGAKKVGAETCVEWGLANRVVPAAELFDEALQLAETLASAAPRAVGMVKGLLHQGIHTDLGDAISLEAKAQLALFGAEDNLEGITAFFEKRKPKFSGR